MENTTDNKSTTAVKTAVTPSWGEQKTKLKAKFSTLTDADLTYENGKKDEMFTKLETKLGKSKEELALIVSTL